MRKIVLFILVLITNNLIGQEHAKELAPNHPHQDNVEVYLGLTYNKPHRIPLLTVGFDYEHRFKWLDYRLGVSLLTDYEFGRVYGDQDHYAPSELLITPVLNFYPTEKFKLFGGGGMLFTEDIKKPVSRLGIGYEFEIHHTLLIIPSLAVDLAKEYQAYLLGFSLGIGFH